MEHAHGDRGAKDYDVVIVGAGPAGCIAARHLSQRYRTLLIDKADLPREKPCGGLLVEESQEFLSEMGMPASTFSDPKCLNLRYVDWNNGMDIVEKREVWNIRRKEFDCWLLKLCEDRVEVSMRTRFSGHRRSSNGITVTVDKQGRRAEIETSYLILGTGGALPMRSAFARRRAKYHIGLQHWLQCQRRVTDLMFIFDDGITDAYSWIVPKGDYVIVGSGLNPQNMQARMTDFTRRLQVDLGIFGVLVKKEAGIILRPQTAGDIILTQDGVLLAGELAGLISPSTGEGISFALRSGYNCARALNEDFGNASAAYRDLCQPLIKEIEDKIQKSNSLSNYKDRARLLSRIQSAV